MIKSINIQNFKIFKKSKFSDFGQVNLLTGLNNGGKTTLLEALYLAISPSNSDILGLKELRKESFDKKIVIDSFDTIWDNIFYLHDKSNPIVIDTTTDQGDFYRLNITCDRKIDDFIKFVKEDAEDDKDMIDISKSLSNQENSRSALHLDVQKNGHDYTKSVLIASKNGLVGHGENTNTIQKVELIPSTARLSGKNLAKLYSQAVVKNQEKHVMNVLTIFDKEIESIMVLSDANESLINIKRKNEPLMLLSAFGDAMNRMIDLVLRIVNHKDGVVLIDEIENGIHYTKHEAIWTLIFTLAKDFNVQIFATTHRKEMLESFEKVATKNLFVEAKFIEVFKSSRTNNIKSNIFDTEKLEYSITHNEPLRGEAL